MNAQLELSPRRATSAMQAAQAIAYASVGNIGVGYGIQVLY